MRKWLIVAVIIIALGLFLPFGFGVHVKNQLDELNGLHIPLKGGELGTLEFAVSDQTQGWLHSTAVITVSYRHPHTDMESSLGALPLLKAPTKIAHGPLLHQTRVEGDEWMFGQALLEAKVEYVAASLPSRFLEITGIETGEAIAYIALLGEQTVLINSREIAFQDISGQLNFSGIDLEIKRSRDGKEIATDLMIPHFNFVLYPPEDKTAGVRWLMDGVSLQFVGTIDHPAALWYGTWFGELEALVNNAQVDINGEHYSINQFAFANIQTPGADNAVVQGESEMQFERLVYNQKGYGPFEAIFSYENIDRAAVENIRQLYDAWLSTDTQLGFMEYLTAEQRDKFRNDLLTLINRLPHYQINNFFLVTDHGNLTGKFAVSITGKADSTQTLEGWRFWQQNVKADLDLRASQALTEDFATWCIHQFYDLLNLPLPLAPNANSSTDYQSIALNLLNQAQIFGIIKSTSDEYEMDAQFQQGRLILNGKPFIDFNQPSTTEAKPQ